MARVEWTRQSGEDVEAVVGMLLCSRFPNAVRVRPSQGDGGIDIFIPVPTGWDKERAIWQIKRYCDNLGGTEKRAIKRSFTRVVETSQKEGWTITEWHLVMPLDLTTQNSSWLDTYIADAVVDFPCETHGLLLCDTLSANYPKIIDYLIPRRLFRTNPPVNRIRTPTRNICRQIRADLTLQKLNDVSKTQLHHTLVRTVLCDTPGVGPYLRPNPTGR